MCKKKNKNINNQYKQSKCTNNVFCCFCVLFFHAIEVHKKNARNLCKGTINTGEKKSHCIFMWFADFFLTRNFFASKWSISTQSLTRSFEWIKYGMGEFFFFFFKVHLKINWWKNDSTIKKLSKTRSNYDYFYDHRLLTKTNATSCNKRENFIQIKSTQINEQFTIRYFNDKHSLLMCLFLLCIVYMHSIFDGLMANSRFE